MARNHPKTIIAILICLATLLILGFVVYLVSSSLSDIKIGNEKEISYASVVKAKAGSFTIDIFDKGSKQKKGEYLDLVSFCTLFFLISVILAWVLIYKVINSQKNLCWIFAISLMLLNFAFPYIWYYIYSGKFLSNGIYMKDWGYQEISLLFLLFYSILLVISTFAAFFTLTLPRVAQYLGGYNTTKHSMMRIP